MKPRILICSTKQFKNEPGIHLVCPDGWYLEDALITAERDYIRVIYAHYKTIGLTFKISCDSLACLLRIKDRGYIVDAAPIAETKVPKRGAK